MISNQLAGLGSVNMPMAITAGAKPYSKAILVFWNKKSMSTILKTKVLIFFKSEKLLAC